LPVEESTVLGGDSIPVSILEDTYAENRIELPAVSNQGVRTVHVDAGQLWTVTL
jgi:hypothetical protein